MLQHLIHYHPPCFSDAAKPTIVIQPQSQQVIFGQEFSLSVGVESPTNHKCVLQWYKNYIRSHGKTDPRLTVKSAVDSDAGEYYCMAANMGGTVDSGIAFVRIINPHPTHHPSAAGVVDPPPMHHPSTVGVVNSHVSHQPSAAGAVNLHLVHHPSTASVVDPHPMHHPPAASDRQAPHAPSWSGGVNGIRHEDLIGRGFLDDAQPMSLTGSMEGHLGGVAGGSGFGSLRFTSRRGSGTTSIGQYMNPVHKYTELLPATL